MPTEIDLDWDTKIKTSFSIRDRRAIITTIISFIVAIVVIYLTLTSRVQALESFKETQELNNKDFMQYVQGIDEKLNVIVNNQTKNSTDIEWIKKKLGE